MLAKQFGEYGRLVCHIQLKAFEIRLVGSTSPTFGTADMVEAGRNTARACVGFRGG